MTADKPDLVAVELREDVFARRAAECRRKVEELRQVPTFTTAAALLDLAEEAERRRKLREQKRRERRAKRLIPPIVGEAT